MSQPRTALTLVVVLLVGAVASVFWWGGAGAPAEEPVPYYEAEDEGDAGAAPAAATAPADGLEGEAGARAASPGDAGVRQALDERALAARVRVLDVSGNAIAGATVRGRVADVEVRETSGVDGEAVLELPPAPTLVVRVEARGFVACGLADVGFGQEVEVRLRPAATILGRTVNEAGEPLRGVRVRAFGPEKGASGGPRVADSDAAGNFRLEDLVPGTYDVRCDGLPEAGAPRAAVFLGVYWAAGEQRQEFPLAPGRTVRGTVRDRTTSQPVAGAEVEARVELARTMLGDRGVAARVRSDADGAFVLAGLPVGGGRIRVNADGYTPEFRGLGVREPRGEQIEEFTLVRGATVRGTVVDAHGAPAAEAEVCIAFGWNNRIRLGEAVKSDAEGRYELRNVPPRDGLLVVANKPGHAPGGEVLGKVQPGEVREAVGIRFPAGVALRGTIRDEEDRVVAGATLTLVPRNVQQRFRWQAASGGDGRFAFTDVTPFPYELRVEAVGYVPLQRPVDVDRQRNPNELGELRLAVAHTVEGRVQVLPYRAGAAEARVTLVAQNVKDPPTFTTFTDAYGRFAVDNVPRGRYRIRVEGADLLQRQDQMLLLDVPARLPAKVYVDGVPAHETGAIAGRLVQQTDGKPVRDFVLKGVDTRRMVVGEGGFYASGIPAGRYDLVIEAKGLQRMAFPGVQVRAGRVFDLNTLWMPPGAVLEVLVVDPRGRPIPADQVRVVLEDQQAINLQASLQPAAVDKARGLYRFEALAPSTFQVSVRGPGNLLPAQRQVLVPDALAPRRERIQLAEKPKPKPKPPPKAQPGRNPGSQKGPPPAGKSEGKKG
ncbi:MAG: carboxypeptidase regulatory-like domain-containing protein [Planctomycetes bacterium]|nr:carboxypeptidase regulatory-like domain-containing protein [Planctomycetota bacterium]